MKEDKGVDRKIESLLIEQEHRFISVWKNFFQTRGYDKDDPRRFASLKAVIWSFVPNSTVTLITISTFSLLTIFLAFEANRKLENQNILLLVQNELQESQRRSTLNIEISSIMEQINREREAGKLASSKSPLFDNRGHKLTSYDLSNITSARIAAISQSLRPYRILKNQRFNEYHATESIDGGISNYFSLTPPYTANDFIQDYPRSPEREQLMIAMINMKISFNDFSRSANFDYVILDSFDLSKSDLRGLNSSFSRYYKSNIGYLAASEGIIRNTSFDCSYGSHTHFIDCDLSGTSFDCVTLTSANFTGSTLIDVNFTNGRCIQCDFTDSNLELIDFYQSNLSGSKFSSDLDFSVVKSVKEAIFTRSNLTELQQLTLAKLGAKFNDVDSPNEILDCGCGSY